MSDGDDDFMCEEEEDYGLVCPEHIYMILNLAFFLSIQETEEVLLLTNVNINPKICITFVS